MNIDKPLPPLPEVLHQPRPDGIRRRRHIGDVELDPDAIRHFNELLEQLDLHQPPLDCDAVASAARELADPQPQHTPACILQRMRRAAAIDRMLDDHGWEMLSRSQQIAASVVQYLRGDEHVIPNTLPVVGRLDDAILVEASWPDVAQEVRDYLHFCRLRRLEAVLRGEPAPYIRPRFAFTREDWKAAAAAEVRWIEHRLRVSGSRYADQSPAPRFHVS